MNVLNDFTELLLFRLKTDRAISCERLEELLESWYALRRRAEREEPCELEALCPGNLSPAAFCLAQDDKAEDAAAAPAEGDGQKDGPGHGLALAPTEDAEDGGREEEPPSPPSAPAAEPAALKGFEPVEVKPNFSGYGAKLKRETLERLRAIRSSGLHGKPVTLEAIVAAGCGSFGMSELLCMLDARRMPLAVWQALSAALDELEIAAGD